MSNSEQDALEEPRPPDSSPPNVTWTKLDSDYHGAVVRLATARINKKQYLLFGYVELYPKDISLPSAFNAALQPWPVPGSNGNVTLGASAQPMPIAKALEWYEAAAKGRLTFPNNTRELIAPPFGVEPSLGRFSVGAQFPVTTPWLDSSRIHRLVPMEEADDVVTSLEASNAACDWLAINVGLDPFKNEEWLAGISLVAPDPLLAGVGHFRSTSTSTGTQRVVVQARPRRYDGYPIADANALQITWLQERSSGWSDVTLCNFDSDGFAFVTLPEPISKVGYAITCPVRGLLRLCPPVQSFQSINFQTSIAQFAAIVEVPAGGRRKPAESYEQTFFETVDNTRIGEPITISALARLSELKRRRIDREQREQAPQRLFGVHDTDKGDLTGEELALGRREAENYVADLVATARERVIFVDPNFGIREFQNYALRLNSKSVNVTVLTGAPHLRMSHLNQEDGENGVSAITAGVHLLNQLKLTASNLKSVALDILVMAGSRMPVFHDRFLVLDDVVWALGPSFNELGERIGLITKVHEPRIIIAAVTRAVKNATCLAKWVANEEALRGVGNESADGTDA